MSLGVAVLKKALSVFKATRDFDFQVEEWHHHRKKDSPSGTAIFLQKELERVIEKKCPPTMVMRAGGIFGVHKVYAVSDEEIIQFEHTAINRTVFARGGLVAAQWIIGRPKGLYSMDDVIS
jgi:4-hydroxy-tetrahydrodipicolinate reductase